MSGQAKFGRFGLRGLSAGRWLLWLTLVLGSVWQVTRTPIVTDVTSFLPGPADAQQRLLADQLRDGISTRLMLIGFRIEPGKGNQTISVAQREALTTLSQKMRERLGQSAAFAWVNNGDAASLETERERLFAARYLLSPAVTAQSFSDAGLRQAFERLERELVAATGPMVKSIAAADPTLESLRLLASASGRLAPLSDDGVWFSRDGCAALILLETAAKGYNIQAQREAINLAGEHAQALLKTWPADLPKPEIEFAGPGYFGVLSHEAIGADAERLSVIAIVLVGLLLWWALRSPRLLALAGIPVVTGALAGFAVVGASYGGIHGITLAFGVTLIGEAVDYAIYAFVQRNEDGSHPPRFWRQLTLAMITSLIGFAAMFFSGFQGLRQLGLFSIAGLIVAAACTRWLLPDLMPSENKAIRGRQFAWLPALANHLRRWRWPLTVLTVAMAALLFQRHDRMWHDGLDALSASSPQAMMRDQQYRADLGVPDLRLMAVARGANLDDALAKAEALATVLDQSIANHSMQGYDSPAQLLPSAASQRARQAALPAAEPLRAQLRELLSGGNFRPQAFEPFVAATDAARRAPLLNLAYYDQTIIGRWLNAQIVQSSDGVSVLIALRGVKRKTDIEAALAAAKLSGVSLIDLKHDVEALVATYRQQAMRAALIGAIGIFLVLAMQLRKPRAVASMVATLVATVIITAALLLLIEGSLTVFNLVALLLVAGVASNYTLFFSTLSPEPGERQRASLSVVLAAASTFIAFAMLSTSSTPVLAMIGTTVALGAAIGLIASMVFSPRS